MTIYHDIDANKAREAIGVICNEIYALEKQEDTEYEIAILRARKQDLKDELCEYGMHFYFSRYRAYNSYVETKG